MPQVVDRQVEQRVLRVDRRLAVLGQRLEHEGEALRREEERHEQRQHDQPDEQPELSLRPLRALREVVAPDAADDGRRRRRSPAAPRARTTAVPHRRRAGSHRRRSARPAPGPARPARATVPSDSRRNGRSPVPISSATKGVAGLAMISAGGAYCRSLPLSITAIRSPRWMASSMSWVTSTMVVPNRFWMASRSSCALARMIGSSAPKGSSISRSFGSAASARATPTRCCWPPESSARQAGRGTLPAVELEQLQQLLRPGHRSAPCPSRAASAPWRCSAPRCDAGTARVPGWRSRCGGAARRRGRPAYPARRSGPSPRWARSAG